MKFLTRLTRLLTFVGMALLPVMAAYAAPAPDFTLRASDGRNVTLSSFKGHYVVLEWWNYECPFVKKHYDSQTMQNLQKKWTAQGVQWFTISSSAAGKQGFISPRAALRICDEQEMQPTAILHDPKGIVGRLYQVQTTPTMVVINPVGDVVYSGAIDSIPSTNADDIAKAVPYLDQALAEAMAGKPITMPQTSSYGCGVKY